MAKQIEDIIPNDKKSIRDIPIPESRRKNINLINPDIQKPAPTRSYEPAPIRETQMPKMDAYDVQPPERIPVETAPVNLNRVQAPSHHDFSPLKPKRKLPGKKALILSLVGLVILAILWFSLSSGATVSYKPKTTQISFNGDVFTAKKEGQAGDLLYSVIKISEEKSAEAPASGEEQVSEKASGKIIVYNNSGIAAQRLIKNTRFETSDGKIYRVQTDITVPGKKGSEPGSLEVTVYADQPGEAYNIGLSDFTLPGLKGDPKFSTIYARSKTPMTGGMIGTVKKVSAADKLAAEKTIESGLSESLVAEAKTQVPDDFVLIPTMSQVTYEKLTPGTTTGTNALVRERGNFSGIIFKKADLIRYVASKKTTIGADEMVDADISPLTINFVQTPTGDLAQIASITFNISGTTQLVWVVNEESLRNELAGKNKSVLETLLPNYPSITSAKAITRPFWKRSFPDEPTKIKLINELK